jgi:hypothetical protein
MKNWTKNRKVMLVIQWVVLVALTAILAVSLYVFVQNLETLRLHGYFKAHFRHPVTLQKISPDQISGWMTFRYINLVFKLPPSYLQSSLSIEDKHYPNLSLDVLAKTQGYSSAQITEKVSAAVKSFLSQQTHQ